MKRIVSPEAVEIMKWAYAGGCTRKEVRWIMNDLGVPISQGGARYYDPSNDYGICGARKNNNYRTAVRYTITEDGLNIIDMGLVLGGGFENTSTITVLHYLMERDANEYELTEHLRSMGIFDESKRSGNQVGGLVKRLRTMKKEGWIVPV